MKRSKDTSDIEEYYDEFGPDLIGDEKDREMYLKPS